MTKPMVRIHNQATGEIIDREMTDAEFAQYESQQSQIAVKLANEAQKAAEKSDLLLRLGLTEAEAKLLLS